MRTRRTTRLARIVAHKCSRLMRRSPLRPRPTHSPPMPSDATGGGPCLHPQRVSSRAHYRAHYSAHGHMQRRAYMRALADVYIRNVAYAHSTSLTRSRSGTLVRTRAHAHAHSQTDRFTHTDGISQERHTQTHTCTHMHTPTHTRTHAHTQKCTHKHKHTHTYGESHEQNANRYTHAKTLITHGCLHTHIHT